VLRRSWDKKSFFLEIARPANLLVENVGDFSAMVDQRNQINREVVSEERFLTWEASSPKATLLPDGHHLNCDGHRIIAKRIADRLQAEGFAAC